MLGCRAIVKSLSIVSLILCVLCVGTSSFAATPPKHKSSKAATSTTPPAPTKPTAPVPLPSDPAKLRACLKRADELPDIAAAEAVVWIKKNGGDDARLCRAFAQANRGMHVDAAREFWGLATLFAKRDPDRSLAMHELAGQEFLRADDGKSAEEQYAAALKIKAQRVESLIGRAKSRMLLERYWDVLDDLNRAIKIDDRNAEAFRQRGRTWIELANQKNAEEDFEHADAIQPLEESGDPPTP